MATTTTYSTQYIETTRARVAERIAAYRTFAAAATTPDTAAAIEAWAPVYFASLVVGLDHAFAHRLQQAAGEIGGPLDEVRLLATAIQQHDGVLTADPAVPYDVERSVLGVEPGSLIALDDHRFERLADAYLTAIETRYT